MYSTEGPNCAAGTRSVSSERAYSNGTGVRFAFSSRAPVTEIVVVTSVFNPRTSGHNVDAGRMLPSGESRQE